MRRPPNLMKSTTAPTLAPSPADPGPPATYLDLYGLSKPPFGGASDNTGYILFSSHKRAFELLVDHLVNGTGVVLLVAEEGLGKTTTLRAAAAIAAESGRQTIMVVRPPDGRVSLTQLVSTLQGRPSGNPPAISEAIERFGQSPRKALIVDDIELMPDDCLRALLPLMRSKPDDPNRPAIILSSSIDLAGDKIPAELSQLTSLAQNTIRMVRLSPAEVRQYIERSLWIAGGTTRRLITADAIKVLIGRSGGLPGIVNRLMEAAFTAGFARGDTIITAKTLAAAMGPTAPRPAPRVPAQSLGMAGQVLQILASGLLVIGASVFLYKALNTQSRHTSPVAPDRTVPQTRPTPMPAAIPPPPANPASPLPPELMAALLKRGAESLDLGDIAAARLLFERAAEAGNATAATALGKTYDPNFNTTANTRDPARAADWYRKAIALGDPKASDLLKRLNPR
jgi:type II secretory pathway predicted ATPase ExeA